MFISRVLSHFQQSLCKSICSIASPVHKTAKVLTTTSNTVYENLAIEDWLFENFNSLNCNRLLLMWRSDPCVVIGKFQNQWLECDLSYMRQNSMQLCRRRSGGGAVYHDTGNVNMSFITRREDYNRRENLGLVSAALTDIWPQLNLSINCRDDLLLDGKLKVCPPGRQFPIPYLNEV